MRKSGFLLALLTLTAGTACSQQNPPAPDDGPLQTKPAPPQPDKDGVYLTGGGVSNPIVLERAAAVYPADARPEEVEGFSLLSLVIRADGTPANIDVVRSHGAAFDEAAIEAVKKTTFEPGSLDGKPVPVRIYARIRFTEDQKPAFPRILTHLNMMNGGSEQPHLGDRIPPLRNVKPPVALYAPSAQYSEQARRAKLGGVVVVSTLVNEDGLPTEIKLVKSLGMGLDENAIECVSRYRFKPGTKDGVPVPVRITIEISFRTY